MAMQRDTQASAFPFEYVRCSVSPAPLLLRVRDQSENQDADTKIPTLADLTVGHENDRKVCTDEPDERKKIAMKVQSIVRPLR